MKHTSTIAIISASLATLAFTSCGTSDPEYKAWKDQQKSQTANNPYGVPQAGGESGTYTPSGTTAAPYQPLPGVNPPPSPQPPLSPSVPSLTPSSAGAPSAPGTPSVGGTPYKIVAGDSLWALAKKHNVTVEALQAANGMTDSNIRIGQTITIPGQ